MFKSMPSLNDSVLHAVFCACYFGTIGGVLVPAWYAFFLVFAVYVLLRYCTTWGMTPWNLLIYTCDVAFVVVSSVLSASIVLFYSPRPAILHAPLWASMLLALAAGMVWIPLVGRHAFFVVSKIWLTMGVTLVFAPLFYALTHHPAFLVATVLVGALFIWSLLTVFTGIVADGATCALVPFSWGIRPLGGVFYCTCLLTFAIVLQFTGPT